MAGGQAAAGCAAWRTGCTHPQGRVPASCSRAAAGACRYGPLEAMCIMHGHLCAAGRACMLCNERPCVHTSCVRTERCLERRPMRSTAMLQCLAVGLPHASQVPLLRQKPLGLPVPSSTRWRSCHGATTAVAATQSVSQVCLGPQPSYLHSSRCAALWGTHCAMASACAFALPLLCTAEDRSLLVAHCERSPPSMSPGSTCAATSLRATTASACSTQTPRARRCPPVRTRGMM